MPPLPEEEDLSPPKEPAIYAKKGFVKSRASDVIEGTLNPGHEWAIHAFHGLLFGDGVVSSSFVVLPSVLHKDPLPGTEGEQLVNKARDVAQAKTDRQNAINRLHEDEELQKQFTSTTKAYVAQATAEVKGEFLESFLKKALLDPSLFDELDTHQVQGLILSTLLTLPGDAKGDNLMVTAPDVKGKRRIVSIDNDWAFASSIVAMASTYHVLGLRSLVLFIPELMEKTVGVEIRSRFLDQSSGLFVLKWLRSLIYHQAQYERVKETHLQNKEGALEVTPLEATPLEATPLEAVSL